MSFVYLFSHFSGFFNGEVEEGTSKVSTGPRLLFFTGLQEADNLSEINGNVEELIRMVPFYYAVMVNEENTLLYSANVGSALKKTNEIKWHLSIIERSVPEQQGEIERLKSFIVILFIFLSIAALILFIIYSINKRLKRAVQNQTSQLIQLNQDLKLQQQRIADSMTFKEQILNNIDTGIVTFNMNLMVTSCNKKAMEMLVFLPELHFSFQHSNILEIILSHYRSQEEKEFVSNVIEVNADGNKQVIYYRILHMYNSRAKQTGYLLSLDDETEKKSLEQKLITQEKLRALGQLVAGVAHEIRNPLTSIQAFVDMLPTKYGNPRFRAVMIDYLPNEVKRLNMIVSDLVNYARPRPSNKQRCSATDLTSLLTFLNVTINKKNIIFEQTINEDIVFFIDPDHIRQVLLNLLLNAVDAVDDTQEKNISMKIEEVDDRKGQIVIQDTGKGIRQEELNLIFEPFYTSKEKGVGLGLTLTYNLIKENNGEILVESSPNQGTVFYVLLPLYKNRGGTRETICSYH